MANIFPDTRFTPDPYKNKIFLCKEYPFSNYNHVYYNNRGHNYDYAADLKENCYKFVMGYHPENKDSTPSTFIVSRVDLTRGIVRVPLPYHQGIDYNYMVITAGDATTAYNKNLEYYYCFIDDLEFSTNGHSCTIHFHIDAWNTFVNKIEFKKSYIEREHVAHDGEGEHIIDEGLSPSNYIVEEWTQGADNSLVLGKMVPLIAVGGNTNIYREGPNQTNPAPAEVLYASDNYGYNPLLIGPKSATSSTPLQDIAEAIQILTEAGQADAILGVYLMPKQIVAPLEDLYVVIGRYPHSDPDHPDEYMKPPTTSYLTVKAWVSVNTGQEKTVTVAKPDISVKNAKTLTYPFCFVNASNQLGNELTLKFENSANKSQISFSRMLDRNINGAMYLVAMNYDTRAKNLDYSIQGMNYPTLPYVIDSYDSYIASNKFTIANSKNYIDNDYNFKMSQGAIEAETTQTLASINNIVSTAGGTIAGNGSGSGPMGILKYFTDLYGQSQAAKLKINAYDYERGKASDQIKASLADKANMPDKFCGRYIPNLLMTYNNPGFIIKTMVALPEELQAVDDYFSRYGYKVNKFETPDLQIRPVFDYKKIIDINLTGQLPTNSINVIKAAFNNGITLWHDKKQLFNFDANNQSPY